MRDGIMQADDLADKIRASHGYPNSAIPHTASPQPPCDNAHVEKGCEQLSGGLGCAPGNPECTAACAGKEPWPPLRIQQLFNEGQSYQEQANRKMRAVELLAKHPEFEDLLELLRLVQIY